jgi:hypothetical protein
MDESMSDEEPMNGERLSDAQRERLLIGAQKLAELEQKLIAAQRELAEAARCFQLEGAIPEPASEASSSGIPESALFVFRDSRGNFAAMNFAGEPIYKADVETYEGPFNLWIVADGLLVRKQYFDEYGNWWIS